MPELPEVETVRKGIEPIVTGQKILVVQRSTDHLRGNFTIEAGKGLPGKIIHGTQRQGKYLLLSLSTQEVLMIHLGMSGQLLINPSNTTVHDHLCVSLSQNNKLVYRDPRRFGMLSLYDSISVFEKEKQLGPDGISPTLTPTYIRQSCQHKHKTIKALLMDQKIIAGIGNIYASEILFAAQVSPLKPANRLTANEYRQIIFYTKQILRTAIIAGGTSLKDHRQANGKLGYFQQKLKVYNKTGTACSMCNSVIQRCIQEGRATFYCPKCQQI